MQLKKIELQGFKSFVDKTVIEFLDGVTTIVGPNGSGKSNISDAIRWVLGEQSVKSLRGSKMEDVIFAGTVNRKKVGFAEASIYFDNTDKTLPVEYKEVVVTRRVYRTGESGYYINNSECRLKDVQELFMDTGIGKDGYSIIGQGKIDEILSNKSEERRAIFEEASGIVKYRTRKEEATRKLSNTDINLSRVNDILVEIENVIGTLEKKSEVAKKYLTLKEELKKVEVKQFLQNLKNSAENLAKLDSIIETYENNQKLEEQNALELEKAKINLKERLDQVLFDIEQTQSKYYEMENELEKTNSKIDIANEKISNAKVNTERLIIEIEKDKENIILLKQEILKKKEKQESLGENKVKFEIELKEKTEELNAILSNMDENELQKEEVKKQIEALIEEKNAKKLEISATHSTIAANEKQITSLISDADKIVYEKDSLLAQKDDIYSNLSGKNNILKDIENKLNTSKNNIDKLNNRKNEIESNENKLNQELITSKSKYNYLLNLENENEGYYKSVKSVLEYAKKNKIDTIYGTLASVISTNEKYEYAIEIALGGYLQNIVVENDSAAKKMVEYLKASSSGRATFLPLNSIKKYDVDNGNKYRAIKGFIGMAIDLVNYNKKFEKAAVLALNNTIIVENIDDAIALSKTAKTSKIVTLSGELISQTGSITGGQTLSKTAGLIGRKEKIEKIKEAIEEKQKEYDKLISEKSKVIDDIKSITEEYGKIKTNYDELNIEVAKLNENYKNIQNHIDKYEETKKTREETRDRLSKEILDLNDKLSSINTDILIIEHKVEERQIVVDEYTRFNKEKEQNINFLNEDIVNLKISLSSFDESVSAIKEMTDKINNDIQNFEISIEKKETQINEYNEDIKNNQEIIKLSQEDILKLKDFKTEYQNISEKLRKDNAECISKQDILEIKMLECIRKIDKIKEEKSKIENKKVKYDIEIENYKNAMWNDYELTVSSAKQYMESLPIDECEDEKTVSKKVEDFRKKIKDLGDVDVNSIEEYKSTKERYDFIISQKTDLEETKKKLENLISNMTNIMKQQFVSQFKIINENFNKSFKELFGGGKAELKLSDETNVLESGIEIEVQPPGKKLQSMMLLSGGERALTAISLLFAILQIKAPPFCVLDEIEAALDDVNVQRFADYIKKYSKKSQFVVITHRKGTMEVASSVYGVTMQEYGVSKIISMKMR